MKIQRNLHDQFNLYISNETISQFNNKFLLEYKKTYNQIVKKPNGK